MSNKLTRDAIAQLYRDEAKIKEMEGKLADYPFMLKVVLAGWDVIEHREENHLDNSVHPYADLKQALVKLADRGMK
jgi:hypothetical protein